MQTVYTPKDHSPAREYSDLALNVYQGCTHDCAYCYVKTMPQWRGHTSQFANAKPRAGIIEALQRAPAWSDVPIQVFLCFTCDPYQPLEREMRLTQSAIQIFHAKGYGVNVLTKAGKLPLRDLDLFGAWDSFGITLTTIDDAIARQWELFAAPPSKRIETLRKFFEAGKDTWVSFEPVLDPTWTLEAIEAAAPFVRRVKIGKWNHDKRANAIDWRKFRSNAESLCKRLNLEYMLKADLLKATEAK